MTQFNIQFRFNPSFIFAISIGLFLVLFSNVTYANETNTDLDKMCARQSIVIAAKLRSNPSNELSEQDVNMIRLGATSACKETYKRYVKSDNTVAVDKRIANKTDDDTNQETDSNKKKSILDRLLSSERKDDVNPMQKMHRTGGK